ncbi:amidohydrolase family protein [Chloroflexota bacterium]
MKRGVLVAIVLIATMLLGCSAKEPVSLPSTKETAPSEVPQDADEPVASLEEEESPTTTPSEALEDTDDPVSSPEEEETPTTTSSEAPEDTEEPKSSSTAEESSASTEATDSYYDGPLFDTHLHTRNILESNSAERLTGYLDRDGVDWAVCFNTFPSSKISGFMPVVRTLESRVVMLRGGTSIHTGDFTESELLQYLQPKGPLWGFGEIGLWRDEYQDVTFNSPQMQSIFQLANEVKGIVMIHMSDAYWGRPTELSEIEPSLIKYPDAIFLFHNIHTFHVVDQLMAKYPNVYFTLDFCSSFFQGVGVNIKDDDTNAEDYLAAVNQLGASYIVQRNLQDLTHRIQKYPDRIFWGTDFSEAWHFDEPVTAYVVDICRQFIGRLPSDVRDKYAYKNAQRVFGHFLTPDL